MLTELHGKVGCLCQPAKNGTLRCPLIIRPTSEDVITGNLFHALKAIDPRWWLPQMLNRALGVRRFRQQVFRKLRIELWQNKTRYPRTLLPWGEGSTQVDATLQWENPPTTVFFEAKYGSDLASKTTRSQGQSSFPSDQLIRNIRVGLFESGYFEQESLFRTPPRDFVQVLLSPRSEHELVRQYRDASQLRTAIPFSHCLATFPRAPFIGHLSYTTLVQVISAELRWMTRPERTLAAELIDYLELKIGQLHDKKRRPRHALVHNPSQLRFDSGAQAHGVAGDKHAPVQLR